MPTILITGASRGIGLGLARVFAADGTWTVIGTARNPSTAKDLASIKGVTVEALDVNSNESIDALAAKYKDTAIDVLVNNAGVAGTNLFSPAITAPALDDFQSVLHTNVYAPLKITLAFLPSLKLSTNAKVVGVSSVLGSIGVEPSVFPHLPGIYTYRASKAALNIVFHTLALDLKEFKISTIVVHPGWVQTDMGGPGAQITVETSTTGLRKVIDAVTLEDTGKFYVYDGSTLPW